MTAAKINYYETVQTYHLDYFHVIPIGTARAIDVHVVGIF